MVAPGTADGVKNVLDSSCVGQGTRVKELQDKLAANHHGVPAIVKAQTVPRLGLHGMTRTPCHQSGPAVAHSSATVKNRLTPSWPIT